MMFAAHQPTYLPLIDFFLKMYLADVFVLADDIQYTKHNFINRTKIKTAAVTQWLTVPVRTKGRLGQRINEVEIEMNQNWRQKHWKTLLVNYKYAAFFDKYADFFEALYKKSWNRLVELNLTIIEFIKQRLRISTKIYLSSDLNVPGKGDQRLIEILEKLGCDTYLCERNSEKHLNQQLIRAEGLELKFFTSGYIAYHQQFGNFQPGLSIVDLLFNEGDDCRDFLLNSATTD